MCLPSHLALRLLTQLHRRTITLCGGGSYGALTVAESRAGPRRPAAAPCSATPSRHGPCGASSCRFRLPFEKPHSAMVSPLQPEEDSSTVDDVAGAFVHFALASRQRVADFSQIMRPIIALPLTNRSHRFSADHPLRRFCRRSPTYNKSYAALVQERIAVRVPGSAYECPAMTPQNVSSAARLAEANTTDVAVGA